MNFKIVIPARYASSRFPGKPLALINGRPMLWHTYQRALETGVTPQDIVIATDDARIFEAASEFGALVKMTRSDHVSGTSRLAEVAQNMGWSSDDIVVNVQGDEPLLAPELILTTAKVLDQSGAGIATLACPLVKLDDVASPNIVKVVFDSRGKALYFSRAAIPHVRDGLAGLTIDTANTPWFRHIGVYAYRVQTLFDYQCWDGCELERFESLEQLRALVNGVHIQVAVVDGMPEHGVDTLEDLLKISSKFAPPVDLSR
ncbi:3-deoxy-manno-octulosonate cytidylyltransferase [Shewanella sp. JM162201]|uniref:8-amino-3,8-dideoxy-manno-octulosonate cytidylyltransferase n=1 Tax=Shewanella jiangmenensis TaxID=2837387 RepID=A0ABS5V5V9_9GAMM|nr:3-deoxy-manno-octulosonate cytidylyltransferase [Shewanella jiangmenensis]MBT1445358.1 3-deoxy-manno-octulosonate cytidylyltransferase [Shewanella jiangmenensis]